MIDLIISAGFDGLHGLAPSAGNDLLAIRERTRGKLTLMGIFEVDHLEPLELERFKKTILPLFTAEGGYILGSAAGLSLNTPLDSLRALYATAD
jgi:hypothetical protein